MQEAEYQRLARIDREHWFYRGKRAIVRHWIERFRPLTPDDLLVDAGMGTGAWLVEMSPRCRVTGLDHSEASLAIARPQVEAAGGNVFQTSLDRTPLGSESATVVTLLDVLEHLEDPAAAMSEMIRIARPGGLLVITVPALQMLWSDWDETLGHKRRYNRRQLLTLCTRPEIELLHCGYFNTLALPAIALARCWRKLFPPPSGSLRAEDRVPSRFLNEFLYKALVVPACLRWPRAPIGVSLLAVMRKRP
ncbi:MAG TPA: class I SAM-dependent methyltransferase [Planctomycetota bacterium]|jgi:ubiquinone/menaquinone biosynthesis C-methylase UbiE